MRNALASLMLILAATGCAATGSSSGEASCALIMVFRGHWYVPLHTASPVTATHRAGSAHFPPCFDHNHVTDRERAAEHAATRVRYPVRALPDVDPRLAFAIPSRYPRFVFYAGRPDVRLADLPPRLRRIITR